jgi:hypothetical protein
MTRQYERAELRDMAEFTAAILFEKLDRNSSFKLSREWEFVEAMAELLKQGHTLTSQQCRRLVHIFHQRAKRSAGEWWGRC